jgi:predicted MFS family arabinose efflux permease
MPVGGTLTAIFVACFFGNIVVVCINSFIATHQGAASAPAFTESTGLAALMGLLAPLGIGLAAATVLGWRAGLLVSVVAFACVELWRGRQLAVYGAPGQVLTRKEAGALPSRTWWALTAGMTYIGAEFCLSLWGADLLRERAGLSPAAAAAGLSTVLGGLFVGRVFGVQIAERMSTERLLRLSIIAGFVAFVVAWLVTNPVAILVALFLTGVGLSLAWPLSMSRIIRASEGSTDRASSLALAFTTTAIGLAPFVLGALAGSLGVHLAFLIVPVLLAVTLVLVVVRPVPEDVIPAR